MFLFRDNRTTKGSKESHNIKIFPYSSVTHEGSCQLCRKTCIMYSSRIYVRLRHKIVIPDFDVNKVYSDLFHFNASVTLHGSHYTLHFPPFQPTLLLNITIEERLKMKKIRLPFVEESLSSLAVFVLKWGGTYICMAARFGRSLRGTLFPWLCIFNSFCSFSYSSLST